MGKVIERISPLGAGREGGFYFTEGRELGEPCDRRRGSTRHVAERGPDRRGAVAGPEPERTCATRQWRRCGGLGGRADCGNDRAHDGRVFYEFPELQSPMRCARGLDLRSDTAAHNLTAFAGLAASTNRVRHLRRRQTLGEDSLYVSADASEKWFVLNFRRDGGGRPNPTRIPRVRRSSGSSEDRLRNITDPRGASRGLFRSAARFQDLADGNQRASNFKHEGNFRTPALVLAFQQRRVPSARRVPRQRRSRNSR